MSESPPLRLGPSDLATSPPARGRGNAGRELGAFLSPVERGVSSRFAEREFAMPVAWRKASERRDAALAAGTRPQVVCEANRSGGRCFRRSGRIAKAGVTMMKLSNLLERRALA